ISRVAAKTTITTATTGIGGRRVLPEAVRVVVRIARAGGRGVLPEAVRVVVRVARAGGVRVLPEAVRVVVRVAGVPGVRVVAVAVLVPERVLLAVLLRRRVRAALARDRDLVAVDVLGADRLGLRHLAEHVPGRPGAGGVRRECLRRRGELSLGEGVPDLRRPVTTETAAA